MDGSKPVDSFSITLQDRKTWQYFDMPDKKFTRVRMIAEEIFPGTKYQDLCLSEISFHSIRIPHTTLDVHPRKTIDPGIPRIENPLQDGQTWRGEYACSQGATNLDLQIVQVDGTRVRAIFNFHHAPSGSRGSFWLDGSYNQTTRELVFKPDSWIERPGTYGMVGMEGQISSDRDAYSGTISRSSCGSFNLKKVSQ